MMGSGSNVLESPDNVGGVWALSLSGCCKLPSMPPMETLPGDPASAAVTRASPDSHSRNGVRER